MEDDKDIEETITEVLMELKLKPDISGFDYLREAIKLCLTDRGLQCEITTKLYPLMAKKFNVNVKMIERNIRFAIEYAFGNKGLLGVNQIYGALIYTNDYRFSNSELIAILTEKIRIDLKVKSKLKNKAQSC